MNDKLFVKVDDICISDELVENNSDNLKAEDFDEEKDDEPIAYQKLEESGSEELLQETRSEGSKEDQHKLDKEEPPNEEETMKIKRSSQKPSKGRGKKKVKLDTHVQVNSKGNNTMEIEEVKDVKVAKKRFDSEPDEVFTSPKNAEINEKFIENERFGVESTARVTNKKLSYDSEEKSARSDDKNEQKIKYVNSTNPTSETSSFKDSSVASNHDGKFINSDSKKKGGKNSEGGSWVVSENKQKPKKSKGNKKKKPLKSDRGGYK